MTHKPKHSIAFSELSSAVNSAVDRAVASQAHGQFHVDKGIIMGRMITEKLAAHGAVHAADAQPRDHHAMAAAIAGDVSRQTHLQLTPEVVELRPGHLIVGFIYQPAIPE